MIPKMNDKSTFVRLLPQTNDFWAPDAGIDPATFWWQMVTATFWWPATFFTPVIKMLRVRSPSEAQVRAWRTFIYHLGSLQAPTFPTCISLNAAQSATYIPWVLPIYPECSNFCKIKTQYQFTLKMFRASYLSRKTVVHLLILLPALNWFIQEILKTIKWTSKKCGNLGKSLQWKEENWLEEISNKIFSSFIKSVCHTALRNFSTTSRFKDNYIQKYRFTIPRFVGHTVRLSFPADVHGMAKKYSKRSVMARTSTGCNVECFFYKILSFKYFPLVVVVVFSQRSLQGYTMRAWKFLFAQISSIWVVTVKGNLYFTVFVFTDRQKVSEHLAGDFLWLAGAGVQAGWFTRFCGSHVTIE